MEENKDISVPTRTLESWQMTQSKWLSCAMTRGHVPQGCRLSVTTIIQRMISLVGGSKEQGYTQGPRKAEDLGHNAKETPATPCKACPSHVPYSWEQNAECRGWKQEWGLITGLTDWDSTELPDKTWPWANEVICYHSQDIKLNFGSKKYFSFV